MKVLNNDIFIFLLRFEFWVYNVDLTQHRCSQDSDLFWMRTYHGVQNIGRIHFISFPSGWTMTLKTSDRTALLQSPMYIFVNMFSVGIYLPRCNVYVRESRLVDLWAYIFRVRTLKHYSRSNCVLYFVL